MSIFSKIKKVIHNWLFLQDVILFESYPDFADSSIYVFDELVKRGYDKKYKFVWSCNDINNHYDKCHYTTEHGTLRNYYYRRTAKYLITNNQICWIGPRRRQKKVYIMHGEPAKSTRKYYFMKGRITAMIGIAPFLEENDAYEFRVKRSKVHGLGLPRNDVIVNSDVNLHKLFNFKGKIIFYYPTIKSWRDGGHLQHGDGYVSSLLKDDADYSKANEFLAKNNVLLVIKLHWASGGRDILNKKYSHILFIDENFLAKNHVSSYPCLAKCDALLTDYSSVFYDYLIVNKPIGFVWTDFERYSRRPGVTKVFVNETSKCGAKIYNINQLFDFITDLSKGRDTYKAERERIRAQVYPYNEISSTKRVTDFIIKTFDLKL